MYVVGVNETCERIAFFSRLKDAEKYCGALEGAADGRYYIDGPCRSVVLTEKFEARA